ncbi:hypothetical protein CMV_004263 [Castanea mollissima]|uniref:Helicase/UvrB N-terminal domain-containing protein n=1 Tax=Castanea mollissima TaxID=60419 RepID=A0A8J4VU58_9ROSI|nr:hypothetical protein CMV_004263 [Castanea mollissima]
MLRRYFINDKHYYGQDRLAHYIYVPGDEIPKWFSHQNVGASEGRQKVCYFQLSTYFLRFQLELSQKALDENIIVYLGRGCGKTHIAVLLIHELGHLIRKPQKNVCIFFGPTVVLFWQNLRDSTGEAFLVYINEEYRTDPEDKPQAKWST